MKLDKAGQTTRVNKMGMYSTIFEINDNFEITRLVWFRFLFAPIPFEFQLKIIVLKCIWIFYSVQADGEEWSELQEFKMQNVQ